MKYAIIFEDVDYDFGFMLEQVETDVVINQLYSVSGILRKFPSEMPISSSYDFESYHNGYAKGYNDCIKTLLGEKLGEYDSEKDKVEDKG